jgi:hypothetical protein
MRGFNEVELGGRRFSDKLVRLLVCNSAASTGAH